VVELPVKAKQELKAIKRLVKSFIRPGESTALEGVMNLLVFARTERKWREQAETEGGNLWDSPSAVAITDATEKDTTKRWRSLVGKNVDVHWVNPDHDWHKFLLISIDVKNKVITLKGRNDGKVHHRGDVFEAEFAEVKSMVIDE
jgi:hypothetical protein